ncbi:early nodulin-like protein 1 [Hordeum vulgare subsp. vulgare]|uniref:Phytocyanin domain-containing protein n=1 Tax=Hordeum vulgare subsp. vulgare TaxID=112509 RepID=A0A8I6X5B8_HORVV|nr:early nodulin-like protein 1 [Hordeum vulgare subsp. vulgare]
MAALMIGSSSKPVHLLPALAFVLAFVAIPVLATPAQGLVFHVGGPRGWRVPDANTSYGWWAMNNRFHVGDQLYFKYENDSVLLVTREEFDACNATEPLSRFADGSTTVRLDRPGFFCFISGEPGHCEEGQRLIVRVMVHPAEPAPSPGPTAYAPGQGGDGSASGSSPGGSSGVAAVAAGGVALAAAMAALCVGLVLLLE